MPHPGPSSASAVLRRKTTLPLVQLWQALRGSAMNEVCFRRQHPFGWLKAENLEVLRFNAVDVLGAKRRFDEVRAIAAIIGERVG